MVEESPEFELLCARGDELTRQAVAAVRLRSEIAALGQKRIKPWRTGEKLATLAACGQLEQRSSQ